MIGIECRVSAPGWSDLRARRFGLSHPPQTPPQTHPQTQVIALRVLTATLKGAAFHSPSAPSSSSSPLTTNPSFPSLGEARAYFPQYVFPELHRLATDPQVGALEECWVGCVLMCRLLLNFFVLVK